MPPGNKRGGASEVWAGVTSVVLLAVLVFAVHFAFWIGLGASILTYFGVTLILRRPLAAPPMPPLAARVTEIESLATEITVPQIRELLTSIAQRARALLSYLGARPDEARLWEDYLRDCLDSTAQGARQFALLSAGAISDPAATTRFADYLTALCGTLDAVQRQLAAAGVADFAARIDAYKSNLNDLNQVYLGEGKSL